MRLKLKQLYTDGHRYNQRDIADLAEKILAEGYRQDPPLVVSNTQYGRRFVRDGTLRFLALSYIAQYSSCKVIPNGIECQERRL